MAYVLSVRDYSKADGKETLYLEPFWWRSDEFKVNPLVKEITDEGFLDYEATLSARQLREMHEQFKPNINKELYQTEGWQKLINERVGDLDWATGKGTDELSHFIAELYK